MTINTLPLPQLHNLQLLLLVHKYYTTNICYPRFIMIIFKQIEVCIVTIVGTKLIFIYIVLTQLLDRDASSFKALSYGIKCLTTLKVFVLLLSLK